MNTSNITNYKPKDFAELLGVSVKTLQRWDREGTLKANRTPTDRRYYTYDQYLQFKGINTEDQSDGFRALGFPGRRKQKVADHIEQAPDHSRNKRSFFFTRFHFLPPNPIFTICIFIMPLPTFARKRKKPLTDGSRRSL